MFDEYRPMHRGHGNRYIPHRHLRKARRMPNTTIDGKKPDSLPANVKARIERGIPKRTAQSMSPLPKGTTVKVK